MPFWPGMVRTTAIGLASEPKVVAMRNGTFRASLTLKCQHRPPTTQRFGTTQEYTPIKVECYGDLAIYIRNSISNRDLCFAEGRLTWSTGNGYRLRASNFQVLHYHKKGFNTRMIYIRRVLWDHVWAVALKAGLDPNDPLKTFYFPDKDEPEAPRDEPERDRRPFGGVPEDPPESTDDEDGDVVGGSDPEEG